MSAARGKVMRGVPSLSLERTFGPSRTGAEKTGWVCESAEVLAEQERQRQAAAWAARAARPVVPMEHYICTCTREMCGGIGIVEGRRNERHNGVLTSVVRANYAPERKGSDATGWQCTTVAGKVYEVEPEPGQPEEGAAATVAKVGRYTCTCSRPTCGGKDGVLEGEQGQRHTGIAAARLDSAYGPSLAGDSATGWVCQPDGPLPPRPKYTCTCNRDSCGGKDGIAEAERGQRHTGVSAARVESSYGPSRAGEAATGWSCAVEAPPAAPRPPSRLREIPAPDAPDADAEKNGERNDKAGSWSIDLLAGAALGIGAAPNLAAVGLKLAVAVNQSRSLYLILPLQAQLINGTSFISLGFGVQYDVLIAKNLYLTPRISLGYSASIVSLPAPAGSATTHLGNFTPEMGIKYIVGRRVNLGLDLVSVPILFNKDGSLAFYRLMALIGINF